MWKSTLKYSFSLGLVLCWVTALSQAEQDSVETEPVPEVKVQRDFRPTGVRFGTDLIQGIRGLSSSNFNGWEANVDVDFWRYYFAFDYGQWAQIETLENGYYENDGSYWRVGADVSFLKKDPDRNMFFLGLRYAQSSFADSIAYSYSDDNFGTITRQLENINLSASWVEITTGLRMKIWKYIWMGYTARIKLFPSLNGEGELESYNIPGYGRASADNWWGFNYQIFFKISVRKEK
jgi:hypothetical protein